MGALKLTELLEELGTDVPTMESLRQHEVNLEARLDLITMHEEMEVCENCGLTYLPMTYDALITCPKCSCERF